MTGTRTASFRLGTFRTENSARKYLESRLWPQGATCPFCAFKERITARKDGFYRCNSCRQDFTVRTGTVMERSHVPLRKWIYAMYLVGNSTERISSTRLADELGITQKSAWSILQKLNEAISSSTPARRKPSFR